VPLLKLAACLKNSLKNNNELKIKWERKKLSIRCEIITRIARKLNNILQP
jgi:hypothetical protein